MVKLPSYQLVVLSALESHFFSPSMKSECSDCIACKDTAATCHSTWPH